MTSVPIPPVEVPRPPIKQEPERLYLFVCNSESMPTVLYVGQVGYNQREQMQPEPPLTARRAEAADLLAFGFTPVLPDTSADMTQGAALEALLALMDRMATSARGTVVSILKERYG